VTDRSNIGGGSSTQPPVRGSGPVEGDRGNREVPPAAHRDPAKEQLDEAQQQAEAEGESLEERLASAEAEAEAHLNDLKRLAAEFENYRKRVAREQQALSTRAAERLVKELLPIVDDLERALEVDPKARSAEAKLEEGVRLVHRQLESVLEREGLAEIETNGKFDPHVHEALLAQPAEAEEGSVIGVLQKGYRLGDRVLRPARVIVAAPKETGGDAGQ
jgi:molecular chaperone GrpE